MKKPLASRLRNTAIKWWQPAELIGISERRMRRWRKRYEEQRYQGLLEPATAEARPPASGERAGRRGQWRSSELSLVL